jgi:alpha-tubulin suppressor-like RCC1 family protein
VVLGQPLPRTRGHDLARADAVGHGHRPGPVSISAFGGCLLDGGIASCFGYSLEGQLGVQPSLGTGTPNPITAVSAFSEIGAGAGFVCALDGGGEIWCWGDRGDGALGDGVVGDPRQPAEVLGQHHPWSRVEVGDEHTCGVTAVGAVYC